MKGARVHARIVKDLDGKFLDKLRRELDHADVVKVGFPSGGKKEPDGTPIALVAATLNYGSDKMNIPERPFLTDAVTKNKSKYAKLNKMNLLRVLSGKIKLRQCLEMLGVVAVGDVQSEIRNGSFTPLAPETIKRKGSSKPLIDTGNMMQSVTYVVEAKDK